MVKIMYGEKNKDWLYTRQFVNKRIDVEHPTYNDISVLCGMLNDHSLFYIETIEYEEVDGKLELYILFKKYEEPKHL